MSLGLILFLTLVLQWSWWPGQVHYRVGDIASADVVAPRHVDYISLTRSQSDRQAVAAAVGSVYRFDAGIAQEQRRRTLELIDRITSIRANAALTANQKQQQILQAAGPQLSASTAGDAVTLTESEWDGVRAALVTIFNQTLTLQIKEEDVAAVKQRLLANLSADLTPAQTAVIVQLVITNIQPNSFPDPAQTAAAQQEAAARSGPVHVVINRGEVILRRGDRIRPEDIERLQALNLYGSGIRREQLLGSLVLVSAVTLPMLTYLLARQREIWLRWKSLGLLMLIIALTAAAARVSTTGQPDISYIFPIGTASMLIGAFLDVPLALFVTALLAILMGSMVEQSFHQTAVALVGGAVGILAMWRLERLSTFFRAGLCVGLATVALAWSFAWSDLSADSVTLTVTGLQGLLNGILCAVLTLGAFGLLGQIFGLTTSLQLMDLARPNQPLLQRLLLEAPGTYHHSLLVSNLAERAAVQIGADALLVRVGAFYHDVGKILHPYFFIENQMDQPNIHSKLPPEVSAQMIAAHVSDGVDLAKEHKLPRSIQDMIRQHHGQRLIGMFLMQARNQPTNGKPIDETKFRYPGPRPQSREAGLIMLADAVEAAVRAANRPNIEDVEKIVNSIFRERILEGELADCDLTLKDMDRSREAFLAVLRGLFHRRIDYPAVAVLSDAE